MKKSILLAVFAFVFSFSWSQTSIATGTVSGSICAGSTITVPFTVLGTFNSTNIFSLELSNASGSFTTPVILDSVVSTTVTSLTVTIPRSTAAGTGYRFRVVSTNPAVIGFDNGANITINASPAAPTLSASSLCLSRDTLTIGGATGATMISWYGGGTLMQNTTAYSESVIGGWNGPGSAANQISPQGIAVDASGNVYVADGANNRIQKFPAGSTYATNATTVAGGNGQGSGGNQLYTPNGICLDRSGNLYIADWMNNRIQKFPSGSTSSTYGTTVAGTSTQGATTNELSNPYDVYVDSIGQVFVTDGGNYRVQKFPVGSTSGTAATTVAGGNGQGTALNQLYYAWGVCTDAAGNTYVSDQENHRVLKYPAGSTSATNGIVVAGGNGGGSAANQLFYPLGICVDRAGNLYVADTYNNRIQKFAPGSTSATNGITVIGGSSHLSSPIGICADNSGNLYVSDAGNYRIMKYSPITLPTTYVPAAAGTYTATYTSSVASGACTSPLSAPVVVNPYCTLTLRDTVNSAACNGTNSGIVTLTAYAGHTPYQYKVRGGNYQSGNVYSNLAPGSYTFYVKDSTGLIDSATATIAQSTAISVSGTVTIGSTTQTITTSVTGGTGPYHYVWPGFYSYTDSTYIIGGSYPTTLFTGFYYVQVTDQHGCTAADSFLIGGTSTLRFTTYIKSGSCYVNNNDDTLVLVGSGGTPYSGTPHYSMRLGGNYSGFTSTFQYPFTGSGMGFATIEDQVGDYSSYYRYYQPTPLVVTSSVTNTSGGLNNGVITVNTSGAQTPYTYAWSGSSVTTSSRTALAAGTYTVTVKEAGGCSVVRTFTVAGPPLLTDTITNALCYGSPSGKVALHAYNGVSPYQFKKGTTGTYQSSNQFTNLAAGTYTFYVKDSVGGTDSIIATITQPTAVVVTGSVTNTSGGQNNGAISVTVTGGHSPYNYAWTGSSVTTPSRTGLAAGTYLLVVTDANGCAVTDTFTVQAGATNVLTVYLDTVAGNNGQTATVHVKVRNFKKIVSAQASIQFNQSVITYSSVSQFAVSSFTAGNFGTTTVSTGTLTFAWSDPTLAGVTLADGTTLFVIQYNVIGTSGQSSPVSLVSSPTQIEFADTSFNPIAYAVLPGLVTVNSSVAISGRIRSWTVNDGVRKTTVALTGPAHSSVLTDTSGKYTFSVALGSADTITPSKANDSVRANGITTLDVLMVQRYILGTYTITGPYKLIAADVNGSGSVTSLDYTLMQSLILGNITSFPGGKLWTFVPSTYAFSNPQSPWGFPTSRIYSSATAQTGQDFTGIKLGDVNGDWNPLMPKTQSSNDSLLLYVPQATVSHGQNVVIPVKARNFNAISGMQFTLAWDSTQLSYVGMDSIGALHVNSGSASASGGQLGIQWTDPAAASTTVPDDSTLFQVYFNVIGAPGDSTLVTFDSTLTSVQFIDSNLNIINPALQAGKVYINHAAGITAETADIVKVYPNPAMTEVVIDLGRPQSGRTEVTITNVSGQVVSLRDISGQRSAAVSVADWAEGVYMVQVRYADRVRNIKLVVIHQ